MITQRKFLQILYVLNSILLTFPGFSQTGFCEIKQMELYTSSRNIVNGTPSNKVNVYKGHQFFGSKHAKTGEIVYDGKTYPDILMNYNILENEILLLDENYGHARWIKLNKKFINSFSFTDKENQKKSSFVCIELFENAGKDIYEEVYSGTISFYIKHNKSVRKQITDKYMGSLYLDNHFFLKKDGEVFTFYSKTKLLKITGNKKALRSYIFKNRLNINKKHPEDIATLLYHYDELKNKNLAP